MAKTNPSKPQRRPASPNNNRPWFTREVFGWAMFDFANQAYTLVILTVFFQIYFIDHLATGYVDAPIAGEATTQAVAAFEDAQSHGRQFWSLAIIIAQSIVIVCSPIIGALADFSGAKKKLLFATWIGCVLFTAAFTLLTPGNHPGEGGGALVIAMILFIISYIFYATGENFLGAFLPELTAHRNMGKVSAFGFTLGYVGGLICLVGAGLVGMIGSPVTGYRLICLWAAAFFFASAIPTFLLVKEKKLAEQLPERQTIYTVGFHRIAGTFKSLQQYKHLMRFLPIMIFYIAGMQVVIFFGGTIAKELFELTQGQLVIYLVVSVISAIAGAFITALYQDRVGTRNTILAALALWSSIMLLAVFIRNDWKDIAIVQAIFWLVGVLVGFGMGMLGTASRAMVGLFSPQHKSAEFFGFYGLAHKSAAILGLGVNIIAEWIFGDDYNLVIASTGIFFIGGFLLMLTVDEKAGRIAALKSARAHVRKHNDYKGEINGSPG